MRRQKLFHPLLILALAILALTIARPAAAEVIETDDGPLEVTAVAGPFDHPWAVAFLPDGGFLVTERDSGTLWRVAADGGKSAVTGMPEVASGGQGGLLDVVAARDFAETGRIFFTFSEPAGSGLARTSAASAVLEGNALTSLEIIFRQDPPGSTSRHFGSRIVEAPDGTLWIGLGDRGESDTVQDPSNHRGKVIRIAPDGSAPADNPRLPRWREEIWSTGHRNIQGATLDPATGDLLTVEHGARGGDEINAPKAGLNYGWPVISYGVHYSGAEIGVGTQKEGMEQPLWYWDPSIAPSGLAIYEGELFPQWQGDLFVGALKAQLIQRLDRDGTRLSHGAMLFRGEFGRIRDVRVGPDGTLWFLTDERDGMLYRVTPAE